MVGGGEPWPVQTTRAGGARVQLAWCWVPDPVLASTERRLLQLALLPLWQEATGTTRHASTCGCGFDSRACAASALRLQLPTACSTRCCLPLPCLPRTRRTPLLHPPHCCPEVAIQQCCWCLMRALLAPPATPSTPPPWPRRAPPSPQLASPSCCVRCGRAGLAGLRVSAPHPAALPNCSARHACADVWCRGARLPAPACLPASFQRPPCPPCRRRRRGRPVRRLRLLPHPRLQRQQGQCGQAGGLGPSGAGWLRGSGCRCQALMHAGRLRQQATRHPTLSTRSSP